MDENTKRMMLAIVICVAVLLAYQLFTATQKTKERERSAAQQVTQSSQVQLSATPAAPQPHIPLNQPQPQTELPKTEAQARNITVDTPLFSAVFNELGGSLRSLLLKR